MIQIVLKAIQERTDDNLKNQYIIDNEQKFEMNKIFACIILTKLRLVNQIDMFNAIINKHPQTAELYLKIYTEMIEKCYEKIQSNEAETVISTTYIHFVYLLSLPYRY